MTGPRPRGGAPASTHLGRLNLNRRVSMIIKQGGQQVNQVGQQLIQDIDEGTRPSDRDLIDSAAAKFKNEGKAVAQATAQGALRAGRAVGSRAMGTRAMRGGIVAAARRAAAKTRKAVRGAARAGARVGAAVRRVIHTVSWAGRAAAALIGALSSTPGLIAAAVAVAVAAAVMAVLSIVPSIGQEVEQQSSSVAIPDEYRQLVEDAGHVCEGVTSGLIAAQIQQESGWDPRAGSDQGAQGISQFMPETWRTAGADHNGDGVANVWDPQDAIPSQARHLCAQLDAVNAAIADGRLPAGSHPISLALAAYNAGFGAVLAYQGVPPYGETVGYVAAILATMAGPSVGEGGVSADISAAVEWARDVAADDTYGYVWGGDGRTDGGYDCSGLTSAVYARLGVSLPRTAAQQQQVGTAITRDELRVGDLIFWGDPAYHVAVYAGDDWMVSADSEAAGINYERIYGTPSSYRRIL